MDSRSIIIRSFGIIKMSGYIGKTDALIHNKESTGATVKRSFGIVPKITPLEEADYGKLADDVIAWLPSIKNNDYLQKCAKVITSVHSDTAFSMLPYVGLAYQAHLRAIDNKSKVSSTATYIGDKGTTITCDVNVLDIIKFKTYDKLLLKDKGSGGLIGAFRPPKKMLSVKIGDDIKISGVVTRHIVSNPVETRITKIKVLKK